jgi:hypothetical protein
MNVTGKADRHKVMVHYDDREPPYAEPENQDHPKAIGHDEDDTRQTTPRSPLSPTTSASRISA